MSNAHHSQSLEALFGVLPALDHQFHLTQRGYPLIMDNLDPDNPSALVGHIVAGISNRQDFPSSEAEEYLPPVVS